MRKNIMQVVATIGALSLILFTLSCGMMVAPVVPPVAGFYTNISAPLELNTSGGKVVGPDFGESSTYAWFGIVAYGNGGLDAAIKNGGLKKVNHIDYKYKNYLLGAYAQYTTVVYGEK